MTIGGQVGASLAKTRRTSSPGVASSDPHPSTQDQGQDDDDGDLGPDHGNEDTGGCGGAVLKFSTDRLHGTSLPRLSLAQAPQPQV